MSKIDVVVIGVVKKGDKFLLTKRKEPIEDDVHYHGYWQFSGGGLSFAEDPIETVKRELREELSIEVEVLQLLPKIYTEVRNNWQGVFITYFCKMINPDEDIVISEEASEYGWYSLKEIHELKTMPFIKEIAQEVQKIGI